MEPDRGPQASSREGPASQSRAPAIQDAWLRGPMNPTDHAHPPVSVSASDIPRVSEVLGAGVRLASGPFR